MGHAAKLTDSVRITYVTQDDLSVNSGYVRRIGFIANVLRSAGALVTITGYASKAPVIESTTIRAAGTWGRVRALFLGLSDAIRSRSDAVVVTSIGAPYAGPFALVCRIFGKRVVYDAHDPVMQTLQDLFFSNPLLRPGLLWVGVMQRLLDRCTAVTIVPAPVTGDLMRGDGWRGPIVCAYNIHGVAGDGDVTGTQLRRKNGWDRARIVAYVGGLQREMRGIESQISAIEDARAAGSDIRLAIVGFGDVPYFEQRLAALARDNAAVLVQNVGPATVRGILAECDIAISSEALKYGMQSKFFEATAAGLRIIARDDGRSLSDVFGTLLSYYDGTQQGLVRALIESSGRLTAAEMRAGTDLLERLVRESEAAIGSVVPFINNGAA